MPKNTAHYTINRKLSDADYENLKYGNIPQETEDKWFWYFEDNKLYAHRSWTGFCIYILSFTPGSEIIDVIANRNPEQYSCQNDAEDAESLNKLLNWWTQPQYSYYHEWLSETLDGKVVNLTTTEDILFSSSSAAADFITGYSVSGPKTWTDKSGRTLKEIEDSELN